MRARLVTFLALIALPILPSLARSAEGAPKKPTVIVRLSSIDDLLADVKYLATTVGHEEEAKQLDGIIKSKIGPKGLEGIDTKRPLGLYATIDPNGSPENSTAVLLVPVSDEKAFLSLLENLGVAMKKEDDGVYNATHPSLPLPIPIYFRFSHQYMYLTARDKAALGKDELLAPDAALPAEHPATISAFVRLADIPSGVKQIAIAQAETALADLEEKKPSGETEAQHALGVQAAKEIIGGFATVLKEGGELGLRLNIDRKADELAVELTLNGKPDSSLAASIAALGQKESLFAGLAGEQSAVSGLFHAALPKSLHKAFERVVDEGIQKELDKEKDAAKRAQAEGLLKVITPTLKAGELDLGASLRGPTANNHYAFVAGIKVKDGEAIEQKLKDALKSAPEADREKIKLDADSVDGHKIHRLNVEQEMDADAKKVLGANPFFVLFRSDAVLVAGGEGGLELIKTASAVKAEAAPVLQVRVNAARLAPLIDKEGKVDAKKAKEKAFGETGGKDKISFTVEGGKSLRLALSVDSAVLKFLSLVEKDKKDKE